MLDQKLQQKLLQKLSPQQIQMIKLLEVPAMQLEQRIKKELEENPALEEGPEDDELHNEEDEDEVDQEQAEREQEEFALDDYLNDEDIPDYRLQINNTSRDEERREEIPYASGASFHENLSQQFNLRADTEREETLGSIL